MTDDKQYPVTSLEEGEEGIIRLIAGGGSLLSRLAGMGIAPAVRIKVLRNSSNLFIVQVAETRIALGRGEASKIIVQKAPEPAREKSKQEDLFLFALAGQPNVGKSTVFNILTGLSQHVGNWPGKTVEKKEGIHESGDLKVRIVDLPGTYSLTSFSEEEKVSRDFILEEHPDAIILLMNAAAMAFIVAGSRWAQPDGQIMFILVITLAAAEASIGLAILLQLYRRFHTLDIDAASEMRG